MVQRTLSSVRPFLAKWALVAVPYLWSLLFFLAPFFIIFKISLSQTAIAQPPYTPVFDGMAIAVSDSEILKMIRNGARKNKRLQR